MCAGTGWGPGKYDSEHNPAGPPHRKVRAKPPYKGISNIDYAANFSAFLDDKKEDQPFCFSLGTIEPHRGYEKDAWKKDGRKLADAEVPRFIPTTTPSAATGSTMPSKWNGTTPMSAAPSRR